MSKAKWMSDPTLSSIPKEKLDFLSDMFDKIKGKNKKELMPFLLAMSSKTNNVLSFTPEEMQLIITAIKNSSTNDEQKQIDKLIQMAREKKTNL